MKLSSNASLLTTENLLDADNPIVGSPQTAHYGWEIYINGQLSAGPGHVYFNPNTILPHYRIPGRKKVEDQSLAIGNPGLTIGAGIIEWKTKYYKLE